MRVLLVEDDSAMAQCIELMLKFEKFNVYTTDLGGEGIDLGKLYDYDIILLDLNLPDMSGYEVLRTLRVAKVKTPILILSGLAAIEDKIKGLGIGADDYLTKPFQLAELMARLRALIRRTHQAKDPVLRVHDLEIDTAARIVKRAGQTIHLTPREFALLQFLAYHRGKVVSRTMIWEHLYDEYDENTSNVVDVYIRYLRTKIDKGFDLPLILTRWGEGYLLRGEDDRDSRT